MFGLILRCVLFLSVVSWYTVSLWSMIDSFFSERYKSFLFESKNNLHEDPIDISKIENKFINRELGDCNKNDFKQKEIVVADKKRSFFEIDSQEVCTIDSAHKECE